MNTEDITIIVLAITAIVVPAIVVGVTAWRTVGAVGAFMTGIEKLLRGLFVNEELTSRLEERAETYLPKTLRDVLLNVIAVYDPIAPTTESDLDDKTQAWLRDVLDGVENPTRA